MSGLWGLVGINETEYDYISKIGQELVFTATQQYLERINADAMAAMSTLVDMQTESDTERFKLPGGGFLERRGGAANSATSKAFGSWDVAFPLDDFGAQIGMTDVAMAYMSPAEYRLHVESVITRNINTMRFEFLRRIFKNTTDTFVDPLHGSLTIQPLANGDAVLYPPVLGSDTEATEDHYLEAGYVGSAISNTNNPFPTIRDELEEHFAARTGGENVVVFLNNAQRGVVEALSSFDAVPDQYIRVGNDTDVPVGLPNVPGKILGRVNGTWAVEWRWIPSNYMLGIYLDAPAPLKMRVDPSATGLGTGLQLIASNMQKPIETAEWRHRFGFGVGNRLNGVMLELANGGGYTIPTGYST